MSNSGRRVSALIRGVDYYHCVAVVCGRSPLDIPGDRSLTFASSEEGAKLDSWVKFGATQVPLVLILVQSFRELLPSRLFTNTSHNWLRRATIGLHDFCAHKNHFSRYDLVCSQRCVEGLALAAKLGALADMVYACRLHLGPPVEGPGQLTIALPLRHSIHTYLSHPHNYGS